MFGQLIYGRVTEIPAFVLYKSPFWSAVFLILIFSVSVWNGGGFYIEVFGRKFERELEALRKELAEVSASSRSGVATPSDHTRPSHSRTSTDDEASVNGGSPIMMPRDLTPREMAPEPVDGLDLETDPTPTTMPLGSETKKQQ